MSLSELITINGVELRNVLADAHVIDITVGAVEHEHTATPRIVHPGSFFGSSRPGTRTIKVKIELPWDKENAILNYGRLISWAKSESPAVLVLPNNHDRCLNCIFGSASEMDLNEWYLPVELTFIAYDPYFYSRISKQKAVGSEFFNAGNVPVPFRIEAKLDAAVTDPQWILDGKWKIALSGTVSAGSIVIDTANESVKLNGESIANMLTLASRFADLTPGSHVVSGPSGTVIWTEGWE